MGDPWVTGGEGKERRRVTSQINGGLEGGVERWISGDD